MQKKLVKGIDTKMKIELSKNTERVTEIDRLIEENQQKYGKRYCPCSIVRNDDTVCICKEFLEQEEPGECHCGKYVKVEV